MKCADISNTSVLEFLAQHQGRWATWGTDYGVMPTVEAVMADVPHKLQHAKMRQLQKRGFVGGCDCGCRGDYEITDKGLEFIGQERTVPYNGY